MTPASIFLILAFGIPSVGGMVIGGEILGWDPVLLAGGLFFGCGWVGAGFAGLIARDWWEGRR